MSIQSFIQSRCSQTAVYWANPTNDGFGHFTFDTPVEIDCRWQNRTQILSNSDGAAIISRAEVVVTQDLDEDGLLYLGSLTDLTTTQKANPRTVDTVAIIKRFEKTPALGSTTEFLRKAFLTPWLT